MALTVCSCATDLQTKVSGNLKVLSKDHTVAILPIETSDPGQKDMAKMFRQGLYANLKQSNFRLLERYIVDDLLKQNNLTDPSTFLTINPMKFGEILGVDAIVFGRINKVERSYFIVHSSIELGVSIEMVDTRNGEILWRAEQTEQDIAGMGKIPTGITAAVFAPIELVTNKFNLSRMTSNMLDKLTALIKKPSEADKDTQFEKPVIAKKATKDLKKIEELQQLKAEWQEAVVLDEEEGLGGFSNEPIAAEAKKLNQTNPSGIPPLTRVVPTIYTIQVGAYKNKSYARKMERSLKKKGYDTFITRDIKKIYHVQVDRFDTKEDAVKLARDIETKEKLKSLVVRLSGV
ncbi:MAG: GNA1162 family protein [Nitrospinales bacterium]